MREPSCDRGGRAILFDWGDTLMRVFPEYDGPMYAWPRVEAVEGTAEKTAAMYRTIHGMPELPVALELLLK